MDQETDITLRTRDPFGADIPNVDFTLKGGRLLGADPLTNPATDVYGFSDTSSTNGSGEKVYADQHYGSYTFTLDPSETGYTFIGVSPVTSDAGRFSALAGANTDAIATLADESVSSLLVRVESSADQSPVVGASVRLSESVSSYDETVTTDAFGVAFFPTVLPPLVAGTYDLEVSATGFTTDTSTTVIGGTALVEETVSLTPS
jgi:hypothetical protein